MTIIVTDLTLTDILFLYAMHLIDLMTLRPCGEWGLPLVAS